VKSPTARTLEQLRFDGANVAAYDHEDARPARK
jgi:hypothetical protein